MTPSSYKALEASRCGDPSIQIFTIELTIPSASARVCMFRPSPRVHRSPESSDIITFLLLILVYATLPFGSKPAGASYLQLV